MSTKKIAGVSVNTEALPDRKVLIEQAKKTREFLYDPKAEEKINKEIDKSGLYRKLPEKAAKSDR